MAADLSTTPSFTVLRRRSVFTGDAIPSAIHSNFDVSPDGKKLLLVIRSDSDAHVVVVYNWATEVRSRLRAQR